MEIFKIGFLALWLLYLSGKRIVIPKLLVFIIPSFLMLLDAAVLNGRRAGMMNLVSYVLVGLWFVRRIVVPRGFVVVGLVLGLILVNAIGTYRSLIFNKEASLLERFSGAVKADYTSSSKKVIEKAGVEFNNYIIYRQVYSEVAVYDYGLIHWNGLVGNYVPAQIVGREFKQALMIQLVNVQSIAREKYGYKFGIGGTVTGYCDAFGSFGWLGFIKFFIIGYIMGVLYRQAMLGSFFGQLLYIYLLGTAMQAITHVTQTILVSGWFYFFALGYPALRLARVRVADAR